MALTVGNVLLCPPDGPVTVVYGALRGEADADPDLVRGATGLVAAGDLYLLDGKVDVLEH